MLVAPVIYSLIVPIVILDIWISLYQLICFPIFGISRVDVAASHAPGAPWRVTAVAAPTRASRPGAP